MAQVQLSTSVTEDFFLRLPGEPEALAKPTIIAHSFLPIINLSEQEGQETRKSQAGRSMNSHWKKHTVLKVQEFEDG